MYNVRPLTTKMEPRATLKEIKPVVQEEVLDEGRSLHMAKKHVKQGEALRVIWVQRPYDITVGPGPATLKVEHPSIKLELEVLVGVASVHIYPDFMQGYEPYLTVYVETSDKKTEAKVNLNCSVATNRTTVRLMDLLLKPDDVHSFNPFKVDVRSG